MNDDDRKRLKNLPLWAIQIITTLEADVTSWKEEALAATGGDGVLTNTRVRDLDRFRGLPPNTTVEFLTKAGLCVQVTARVGNLHTGLDTISVSTPDGALSIIPGSSNSVEIMVRKR